MPDVYLCAIEPLIAIILARVCGSDPLPPPTLSLPSLGVSSLDLGRLRQRRRPFFLCMPSHPQQFRASTDSNPAVVPAPVRDNHMAKTNYQVTFNGKVVGNPQSDGRRCS